MTPYSLEEGPASQLRMPTTEEVFYMGRCAQSVYPKDRGQLFTALNEINRLSQHLLGLLNITGSNILYSDGNGLNSIDPLEELKDETPIPYSEYDFNEDITVTGAYAGLMPVYLGDSDHDESESGIKLASTPMTSTGSGVLDDYYSQRPNQYHVFARLRRQQVEEVTATVEKTYNPLVFVPLDRIKRHTNLSELDRLYGHKAIDRASDQGVMMINNIIDRAIREIDPREPATDNQIQAIEAWDIKDYHVMNELRSLFVDVHADVGFLYSSPEDDISRKHTLRRPVREYHGQGLFSGIVNAENNKGILRPHFAFYMINEESSADYVADPEKGEFHAAQAQNYTHMTLLVPVSKRVTLLVSPAPY